MMKGLELAGRAFAVLAVLAFVLEVLVARRASTSKTDEIPVERQYQPIEPGAGSRSVLERASSFLQKLHQSWQLLMIPIGIIAAVIAIRIDPMVRSIALTTLTVMFAVIAVWAVQRRRTRREDEPQGGAP
jgi:hypothetical protein